MFRKVLIAAVIFTQRLSGLVLALLARLPRGCMTAFMVGLLLFCLTSCATLTKGTSSSTIGTAEESSMSALPSETSNLANLRFSTPALAEIKQYASRLWERLLNPTGSKGLTLEKPKRSEEL